MDPPRSHILIHGISKAQGFGISKREGQYKTNSNIYSCVLICCL